MIQFTTTYKGIEINILHSNPNKQPGAIIISITKQNTIWAYTNRSLTDEDVMSIIDQQWNKLSNYLYRKVDVTITAIVDKSKLKPYHEPVLTQDNPKLQKMESIVRRYSGFFHSEKTTCDCCKKTTVEYYSYWYGETGEEFRICFPCRSIMQKRNPFSKEKTVNFEGNRQKH